MVKNTGHKTGQKTGLLAIFVDLDPQWWAEFREFLAEDMFPPRHDIGFGPCGSFDLLPGTGSPSAQQFLTIYETPELGDLYGAPYQGLRKVRAPRDAAYHQRFKNQDRYTLGMVGPALEKNPGAGLADILWVDRFDLADADVQGFNIWFETVYLPALADIKEVVRMKRYLVMEGTPKHMIVHQLADQGALQAPAWLKLRADPAWQVCTSWPAGPAAYVKAISAP